MEFRDRLKSKNKGKGMKAKPKKILKKAGKMKKTKKAKKMGKSKTPVLSITDRANAMLNSMRSTR